MVKSEPLPLKATSIKGIARMYGLGKTTLRKAINEGRLRAIRIGRRTVIRIADAEQFIASGQEIKRAARESSAGRRTSQPERRSSKSR